MKLISVMLDILDPRQETSPTHLITATSEL